MALWFALVLALRVLVALWLALLVVARFELALVARLPVALVFELEAAASLMPKSCGTMLLACELAFELTGLVKAPPPLLFVNSRLLGLQKLVKATLWRKIRRMLK